MPNDPLKKVIPLNELLPIISELKKNHKTIVTTNGCFDILHLGHAQNLHLAKQQGDILIVGVNTDSSVKNFKSPHRPIINQNERASLVAHLEAVDFVFLFDDLTPIKWLEQIQPHVHVKGNDRKLQDLPEYEICQKLNIKIHQIPLVGQHSTTHIIQRILDLGKVI